MGLVTTLNSALLTYGPLAILFRCKQTGMRASIIAMISYVFAQIAKFIFFACVVSGLPASIGEVMINVADVIDVAFVVYLLSPKLKRLLGNDDIAVRTPSVALGYALAEVVFTHFSMQFMRSGDVGFSWIWLTNAIQANLVVLRLFAVSYAAEVYHAAEKHAATRAFATVLLASHVALAVLSGFLVPLAPQVISSLIETILPALSLSVVVRGAGTAALYSMAVGARAMSATKTK